MYLKCGQWDWGTKLYLTLINLNVNSHMWPVVTVLNSTGKRDSTGMGYKKELY